MCLDQKYRPPNASFFFFPYFWNYITADKLSVNRAWIVRWKKMYILWIMKTSISPRRWLEANLFEQNQNPLAWTQSSLQTLLFSAHWNYISCYKHTWIRLAYSCRKSRCPFVSLGWKSKSSFSQRRVGHEKQDESEHTLLATDFGLSLSPLWHVRSTLWGSTV